MQAFKPIGIAIIVFAIAVASGSVDKTISQVLPVFLYDLRAISDEEVCDAICETPTGTVLYYFYEADMLVLRQVYRGLQFQKALLRQNINTQTYTRVDGKENFRRIRAAFHDLTYAFQGVDADFLRTFDMKAKESGLDSPIDFTKKIVSVAREVCWLGKEWLRQCHIHEARCEFLPGNST